MAVDHDELPEPLYVQDADVLDHFEKKALDALPGFREHEANSDTTDRDILAGRALERLIDCRTMLLSLLAALLGFPGKPEEMIAESYGGSEYEAYAHVQEMLAESSRAPKADPLPLARGTSEKAPIRGL